MIYLIERFSFIIWFLVFFLCFLIETKRKDILFIYFSISSLLSGIYSLFVNNIEIQIVIFIISSLIFITFIKLTIDKAIEYNFKFKHEKYMEDRFCIIIREENKELDLYKVITKSGIYKAKYISNMKKARKFQICNIIYDDGNVIIIK